MRRKLTLGLAAAALSALAACSTTQLAQQGVNNDDVYFTETKAKEEPVYTAKEEKQPDYRTEEQLYGGNDYSDDYYADRGEYATRIDRFYYHNPWRGYYDSWYYSYDPWYDFGWGFNSWYRPGFSISLGWGSPWYYDNYYWGGYYGYPYYSRYWGPVSYYNYYPSYGYYGYPYYSNYPVYTNKNYRSRPSRETTIGRGNSIYNPGGISRGGTRTSSSGNTAVSRPTRGTNNGTPGRTSTTSGETRQQPASRPSRPSRTEERQAAPRQSSTPPRQDPPSRPTYSRPERSAPSSSGSSYGGGSSSSGGGSSSSGRSSGGGRPSR